MINSTKHRYSTEVKKEAIVDGRFINRTIDTTNKIYLRCEFHECYIHGNGELINCHEYRCDATLFKGWASGGYAQGGSA